jgi:hypothetical protein
MNIPLFSTKTLRLDKKIQDALSVSPLMDSSNLSKMVLNYVHPIAKRYLYSIDVGIDFKEEVKTNSYGDFDPIDFFLLVLAKDETEAATQLIHIVERFPFKKELDFSIDKILKFKQRYADIIEPNLGVVKRKCKPFYTIAPVVLYHAETQLCFEEIYRYSSDKKRKRCADKNYSRLQDFPVTWF